MYVFMASFSLAQDEQIEGVSDCRGMALTALPSLLLEP